MKNGVQGSFTLGPSDSVLGALHLVPVDIRYLAPSWLSAAQSLYLSVELQKLVAKRAAKKRPVNRANITEEM